MHGRCPRGCDRSGLLRLGRRCRSDGVRGGTIFMRAAAAAVAAIAAASPLAEIAENEAAVTVLSKPAGIVQHHSEFFIFELTPGFEFGEVDTSQHAVVRFENAHAAARLGLGFLDISEALKQRDRGMESMIVGS